MWGPILSVTNAMVDRTIEVGKQRLREVLEIPEDLTLSCVANDNNEEMSRRFHFRKSKVQIAPTMSK